MCQRKVAYEITNFMPSLKKIVADGIDWDARIPTLKASLEYIKYQAGIDLPTSFVQAQLDSFGAHGVDYKSEPVRYLLKGDTPDPKLSALRRTDHDRTR